ncbi:hypothetical protein Dsin_023853 [Dipteronia sinensis]|uniref:Disease resistance protein At4g27190-like leucine-rich repeats domain-containing protein n=1 Tax=Dipteronia sinensis TaxID=43782 RepID=A0AAE0E162_9ROSI|nr:hypothetical protein Dsin_023853 [Dipteronia sinensis]
MKPKSLVLLLAITLRPAFRAFSLAGERTDMGLTSAVRFLSRRGRVLIYPFASLWGQWCGPRFLICPTLCATYRPMSSKKIYNLTRLRLLDLNGCEYLRNIPPNVLSTFTQLEELYFPADIFGRCQIKWEVEGVNILDELKNLKHLTVLTISIPDANVLPKGRFLSKKLERYEIFIGSNQKSPFYRHGTSRMVQLNLQTSSCCDNVQKFLSVLDGSGFPELEYLHVENSSCFRTVVDCLESESCHHFLFLGWLSLHRVLNLERIHNHQLSAESFCRLRTITVEFCHKLKNVFSFSTYRALPLLQEVNVSCSNNMEEIFAIRKEEDINIDKGTDQIEFKQLRSLELKYLPKLTRFCSINGNKETLDTLTPLFYQEVVFSNLETLKLRGINFEKIWHNELPALSSCLQCLKQLTIEKCSTKLKVLFSSSTVAFSSLEEIKISELDDLEMIWHNQLRKDSFCNLKSLDVTKCNKLLTIFPYNMLERTTRLESLTIHDCYTVEEIFDLLPGVDFEESHSEIETRLRELDFKGLPNLKRIWNKDPQKMFSFQKLNRVKVLYCTSLKYIFPFSIAKSLTELEQLHVHSCGVEEIVADDQGEAKVAATFVLPRITFLKLNCLPLLKTFYSGVHMSQWQNLKRLIMCGCDKVELFASELFNFQENNEGQHDSSVQPLFMVEKVTFPSLEQIIISESNNLKIVWHKRAKESFCNLKSIEVINCALVEEIFYFEKVNFEESHSRAVTSQLQQLRIKGLPKLKHIWHKDAQAELSFENLQKVEVSNCQSLKDLFPASIARSLLQLIQLKVERCGKLEEIVAKEGESKAAVRFVFPEVTSIGLYNLPQLRAFYPGVHSSKWLVLKELEIVGCDKIELLASELLSVQENNEESHLDIPAQQPLFLVEKDSFPVLEKLILRGEGTQMISQGQFSEQLFCNLKFLGVYNDNSAVFPLCILQRFCHLQELHLIFSFYGEIFSYEKDETHVGIDSKLDMVLQKLESLFVEYCDNLIQLVPSSTSFQNLTFLEVMSCKGLRNLMTSSTAKSLLQLREMAIGNCESMIRVVVAKEGDVTGCEIIFSQLRTLTLKNLPSLLFFCSENYTLELPFLEDLNIFSCSELKSFSSGDLTIPMLQKVKLNGRNFTLEGDLNTTIQKYIRADDSCDSEDEDSCDWEDEDSGSRRTKIPASRRTKFPRLRGGRFLHLRGRRFLRLRGRRLKRSA